MTVATTLAPAPRAPRFAIGTERLRQATLGLMVFAGSVTMFEPSPYEFFGTVAILTWMFGGLKLGRELLPILILVLLYMIGALTALIGVMYKPDTVMWTLIGWYLAATGLFYAMVLSERSQERLDVMVRAYLATALVCSVIGAMAYARLLPSADSFLRYQRVKSTFEDPNVFAPFLVFPALVLMQRLYLADTRRIGAEVLKLLVILSGVFLSFSRGAWAHLVASLALMTLATLWCAPSPRLRARIAVWFVLGAVGLALLLAFLLSFDAVSSLFEERAKLEQSYDLGEFGRFNRHRLGFVLALDKPLGIGRLQFSSMFGEDPHNTYLNGFLSYGWLGGVAWPTIVVLTLIVGWRSCLRASPWRQVFICAMSTYTAMVGEAWIIDIDHWRHAWLLFGMVWGLSVATGRATRRMRNLHNIFA
jgi:hypothetical protein